MRHPTLLDAILDKRGWRRYEVFMTQLASAGARAAKHYENPRLARVKSVGRTTFARWCAGAQEPRGDTAAVMEFWFGHSVKELFGPAPELVLARSLPVGHQVRHLVPVRRGTCSRSRRGMAHGRPADPGRDVRLGPDVRGSASARLCGNHRPRQAGSRHLSLDALDRACTYVAAELRSEAGAPVERPDSMHGRS